VSPLGDVVYFGGEYVPLSRAMVPITTNAFNYGTGCFEGIRAYWNEEQEELYALLLPEHMERMVRSARILKLDLTMDAGDLTGIALELLRRNEYRCDAYIRPIAYKSGSTIKVALTGIATDLCMYTIPMGDYLDTAKGLDLTVSAWRRIEDNAIPARAKPTGAYINAAMASDEARVAGFDEALMLTSDGHVAEAASSNLFLVVNDRLVTPEAVDDILEGITRAAVLSLGEALEIPTESRRIDRSELYAADEVFLCGTGVQIAPVSTIDGRAIGTGKPGPVTMHLQTEYLSMVRGRSRLFPEWRTPVYERVSARFRDPL
jgi:branched-chain amino acid aminotransferase